MFKIDYNRDDRAWQIYESTTWEKLFSPGLSDPLVAHYVEIAVPIRLHVEPKGHGWIVIVDGSLELRSFDNNLTEARFT